MKRVLLSGWFVCFLLSPVSHAAGWGERGISKRFAIDGGFLYSADGRGVTAYDISNPASMRAIDVESGNDESFDVALMGPNDLLLATESGLDRFLVADDGTLSRMEAWPREGGITRVAANENWAAAAREARVSIVERQGDSLALTRTLTFGHAVLDMVAASRYFFILVESEAIYVVDAQSGEQVSVIGIGSGAIALSGSTLWSASRTSGLVATDVSDPLSPKLLSTTGLGTFEIDGVKAAGSRVYVFAKGNTIQFFDASDLTSPQRKATRTEWIDVAAASGEHLFFSGPRLDRDGFPYATGTPVRAFDADNLSSPQVAGEVRALAGPVSGVWTDGSIAYVVDPPFFRVLDVSKTDEPREMTAIELPGGAPQLRLRVKNRMAVVYGRDYVHLIDVSDPIRPRFKATWNPQGHSPDDVALMADGLFVEVNDHSGIHVVNYGQYDPPAQVGGRIMHWHSVAAGDDAIYVLSAAFLTMSLSEGTQTRDVTVIAQPALSIDTAPPNADRPAFVILRQGTGLRIFSLLEDRFRPQEIAFAPVAGAGEMATGEASLVVDIDGMLSRLELSNPTVLLPTDMRVTSAMQISMAGEKIVVADRYRVRVYGPDTPPPPSPATSKRRSVGR
jgi:hypothetical protein